MQPSTPLAVVCTALLTSGFQVLSGQPNDPLFGERNIASADDIVLMWTFSNDDELRMQQYNFTGINTCDPNSDDIDMVKDYSQHRPFLNHVTLDAYAADLDEDGYDEVISLITENTDSTSLIVLVHQMIVGQIMLESEFTVTRLPVSSFSGASIQSIELDGDLSREILIAIATTDGNISLMLLDGNQTTQLDLLGKVNVTAALRESYGVLFDVLAFDFDQNGREEILLMGVSEDFYDGHHAHAFFGELYKPSVGSGGSVEFIQLSHFSDVLFKDNYQDVVVNLRLAGGDFNGDYRDEFMLAYQLRTDDSGSAYYLMPGSINTNLREMSLQVNHNQLLHTEDESCCNAIGLIAGDITLDLVDDLVFTTLDQVLVLEMNEDTTFSILKTMNIGKGFDNHTNRHIAVNVDLDAALDQSDWKPEITILETLEADEEDESFIHVYQPINCMDDFDIIRKTSRTITTPGLKFNSQVPVAMVSGRFDNVGIYLGKPTVYYDSEIVQPLVVINAPPTHFDILGGQVFDIAGCYNHQACDFTATYDEGIMEQEQITTTQTQDFDTDTTWNKNLELAGNKWDKYTTHTYGETFSNVLSKNSSVTVGVNVKAMNDDMVFTTISDFEVWEYPMLERDSFLGYFSVTVPHLIENRWFPSKSVSGLHFLPEHELGNILSYPELSEIADTSIVAEVIKGTTNVFTLGPKTAYQWRLEFSDFEENNVSEQKEVGVNVGRARQFGIEADLSTSVKPFGVGVDVSGHVRATTGRGVHGGYSNSTFTSHITSVKNELLLKIELGDISGALTGYRVSPYAYWSRSGALIVDYAVEPELTVQGNFESWWLQQYGKKPDPALLLPWKYDPEKGYAIAHESQRTQTKDIVIEPRGAVPGDTVLLFTRLHNYSLVPTPDSVRVQWFLGDPDAGGVVIADVNGVTEKYSSGPMAARSDEWVHMRWVLPDYSGRIYAVLDGDQQMEEIHENNNKGWIGMNQVLTAQQDENNYALVEGLGQNYPNPFSEHTTIPVFLVKGGHIAIELFDVLGRSAGIVWEGYVPAGHHSIPYDGSALQQGIYYYVLAKENQSSTMKLMVADY